MNLPLRVSRTAANRLATRRARLGTLAAQPAMRSSTAMQVNAVAQARTRSRFGLLLLMASALFFTYFLWV